MKLSIKNFKCFLSEEIFFNDLSILVGANSSGKSSAIWALLLMREFFIANEDIIEEVIDKKILPKSVGLNNERGLNIGDTKGILHYHFSEEVIKFKMVDGDNYGCTLNYFIAKEEARKIKINKHEDYCIDKDFLKNPLFGKNTFRYLCAERLGPQNSQSLSNEYNPTVGIRGEFLAHVISTNARTKVMKERHCPYPDKSDANFQVQLNLWLNYIIPNIEVRSKISESQLAMMDFIIKNRPSDGNIAPPNMGFGVSYFLPILATCLLAPRESLIIIENPEAHLSPRGQSRMGFFLGFMVNAGLKIVIETHSDYIVNGIRLAVKENILDYEKVIFNYFNMPAEKTSPVITSIKMDKYAKLELWPLGFFDQIDQDLMRLNQ